MSDIESVGVISYQNNEWLMTVRRGGYPPKMTLRLQVRTRTPIRTLTRTLIPG